MVKRQTGLIETLWIVLAAHWPTDAAAQGDVSQYATAPPKKNFGFDLGSPLLCRWTLGVRSIDRLPAVFEEKCFEVGSFRHI